jgi:hypothetical protein
MQDPQKAPATEERKATIFLRLLKNGKNRTDQGET